MKNSIPRRTLQELSLLYENHPERCDVYVEGPFDKSITVWFIRQCELESVSVYTIEAIEIPDDEIIASGRKANNRERVVFLSSFLDRYSAERATCIVDADFSHLFGEENIPEALMLTDYSCMEMYFFTHGSLSKFLSLCCQRNEWPVNDIMKALSAVLQELFLFRFANERLNWRMDLLDKVRCMKTSGWSIVFDRDEYIKRFLMKNNQLMHIKSFIEIVEELRKLLRADTRFQIHGHDFVLLLAWYIRRKGITDQRSDSKNVLHYLVMSADYQKLSQETMFQGLVSRLSGAAVATVE